MRIISFVVLTILFSALCIASDNKEIRISEKKLLDEVIEKNSLGVNNRQTAIEFYKKKIKYLNIDTKGNLRGFSYSNEYNLNNDDLMYLVFFPEVEGIHFSGMDISDECFFYFQNHMQLGGVSALNTKVTGEGFKYLSDKIELQYFNFSGSPITDKGLEYLSQIKYKNPIVLLYLDGTKVTDKGLKYIAMMKFDRSRIDLSGTAVTDNGIKHLAGFKNMIEIFLYNTKVTDKGGKWLEAQLPDTTVYWGKRKLQDEE